MMVTIILLRGSFQIALNSLMISVNNRVVIFQPH